MQRLNRACFDVARSEVVLHFSHQTMNPSSSNSALSSTTFTSLTSPSDLLQGASLQVQSEEFGARTTEPMSHDNIMKRRPDQETEPNATAVLAAGSQQLKVVQIAFIHKLYKMLENQKIQHLISWSLSSDTFVMSPSKDFSKVLE